MNVAEHPPHNMEIRLQWIAIICMAIGLVTSVYYHANTLKAEHIKNEIDSYLHLNDRYHKLLFTLLQNDPEIFNKTDDASLKANKYILYELFELFATVSMLEGYFSELDKEIWPCWERRMNFLFTKPAMQHAWQCRRKYAEHIYKPEFVNHVERSIAHILSHDSCTKAISTR